MYPNATIVLGFLVSVVSLIGAIFGLVVGTLAARRDLKRVLLFGLVLGAMVSLVQFTQLPLNIFLLTRILEGVSHLAIVVSAPTLIAWNSSRQYQPLAMTLWGTFFGVSFALTGWLGLAFVSKHGVSSLFMVHGLLMGLIALLVLLIVPAAKPTTRDTVTHTNLVSWTGLLNQHKHVWGSPTMAAPAAGWLFYTLTFLALLGVLPSIMPPELRGLTASGLPIASIITSLTLGALLLRVWSAVKVVCLGFVAALVPIFLLPLQDIQFVVCIALFVALGLVQGASFAAIPQLNTETTDQVLANGAFAQAGNIGNLCGTPLLLLLYNVGGVVALSAMVGMCYLLAIGAHYRFAMRRTDVQTGLR